MNATTPTKRAKENGALPASPCMHQSNAIENVVYHDTSFGLTKREKFAAMFMQKLIKHEAFGHPLAEDEMNRAARRAIIAADILLEELAK